MADTPRPLRRLPTQSTQKTDLDTRYSRTRKLVSYGSTKSPVGLGLSDREEASERGAAQKTPDHQAEQQVMHHVMARQHWHTEIKRRGAP